MNKKSQVFIPLLREFTKLNYRAIKESGYPWAPFIPYTFSEYEKGKPRIFYVGIDTFYWGTTPKDLIEAYEADNYANLFNKNDNVVTPQWHAGKGVFWEFVYKMQLYLKDQKLRSTSELQDLSPEEERIISEIGYGNANLIELPRTLIKEDYWESINENMYWQISESAKTIFSPLKNILDSFHPDIIFVLGADLDNEILFRNLTYTNLGDVDDGKWRKLYYIHDYNVRVVKTYHPCAFYRQGSNNDEMVKYLYLSMELFEHHGFS